MKFTIGEIKGFTKNDIHYKYNFKLLSGRNDNQLSSISPKRSFVYKAHPNTLDFINTDSIDFYIAKENFNDLENIRINPDGNNLSCKKIGKIKKCTVTKDHFKDKSSGYYYIHHKDTTDKYSKNCEAFGFKVTLPGGGGNESDGNAASFNKYSFAWIALLGLLLI